MERVEGRRLSPPGEWHLDYLEVEEARNRPGLRLALTAGGPGPWSESAKALFQVKGVSFLAVRQVSGEGNEALQAWTGHRNAPVAVHEDEPARADWLGILMLAERLAPRLRLLPETSEDRALALGLSHEICGEQGLGWCRRLLLLHETLGPRAEAGRPLGKMGFMAGLYGYDPRSIDAARRRVLALLEMLSTRLEVQARSGSDYFVGRALSAVDLYWACFAAMFAPLPEAQCAMPEPLRKLYTVADPAIRAALSPRLLAHRDAIYERHLSLPLDF